LEKKKMLDTLGCDSTNSNTVLSCIRSQTAAVIQAASPVPTDGRYAWRPIIDGVEITQDAMVYIQSGSWNKVPILIGNNLNEYAFFLCPLYQISTFTAADYSSYLTEWVSASQLAASFQLYPISNYPNALEATIDVFTDMNYKCQGKALADAVYSTVPVFYYSLEITPGFSNMCFGCAHSFDLPFIFPALLPTYGNGEYSFNQNELTLGTFIRTSWGKFMYTTNPGNQWVQYSSSAPYIVLNTNIGSGLGFKQTTCNYWNLGILSSNQTIATQSTKPSTSQTQSIKLSNLVFFQFAYFVLVLFFVSFT